MPDHPGRSVSGFHLSVPMKKSCLCTLSALIILSQPPGVLAGPDPFAEQPSGAEALAAREKAPDWNRQEGRLRVEVISVPAATAWKLQRLSPADAALHEALCGELEKGSPEVGLVHLMNLRVVSGKRAKAEEIDEICYPTEYSPGIKNSARIPDKSAPESGDAAGSSQEAPVPPAPARSPEAPPAAATGAEPKLPVPLKSVLPVPLSDPSWVAKAMIPASFETKNAGWTLEAEAHFQSDGPKVDVNLAIERIALNSFWLYAPGAIVQPEFRTQQLSVQLMAESGQPALAGTLTPPASTEAAAAGQPDGGKSPVWLVFVTVVKSA